MGKKSGIITKYRPKQWSEIKGQSKRVAELTRMILSREAYDNNYLIFGPFGAGKTTIARLMAKSILCEGRLEDTFEPCGMCPACVEVEAGGIMRGFVELDAGSSGGIDQIREVLGQAHQHPGNSTGWKVFLIDECHLLTGAAASALLKVLEEKIPVVFLMVTTEPQKMIDTVKSRLKHIQLEAPPADQILPLALQICESEGLKWESEKVRDEILNALVLRCVPHVRLVLQGIGDIKSRFVNATGVVLTKDALLYAKGTEQTWFDLLNLIHKETVDPMQYEQKLNELESASETPLDSQFIGFMKVVSGKAIGRNPLVEGLTMGECRGVFFIMWDALRSQSAFKAFFKEVIVFALVECAQAKKEGYLGGLMKFAGEMIDSQRKNEAFLEALGAIAGKERQIRQKLDESRQTTGSSTDFSKQSYD